MTESSTTRSIAASLLRCAIVMADGPGGHVEAAINLMALRTAADPSHIIATAGGLARALAGQVNSTAYDAEQADDVLATCELATDHALRDDPAAMTPDIRAARAVLRTARATTDEERLLIAQHWEFVESTSVTAAAISTGVELIRHLADLGTGNAALQRLLDQFKDPTESR